MKKVMILLFGICTFLLTGCGKKEDAISKQLDEYIINSVEKKSAIELDKKYIQYENILKKEKIDEEGFCYSSDIDYSALVQHKLNN